MKRYDEYNNIHIKNDSLTTEYGKTQKAEFTSFGSNPEAGRSSANEIHIINDDREKIGQLGGNKKEYEEKKEEQSKKETIKQATNATNASSASAGSSAAGAAGATAGAVVGGAIIATTTVAATLGTAVLTNTSAKFEYLKASSNNVYYVLNIEDESNSDDVLKVESNSDNIVEAESKPSNFSLLLHIENEELGYNETNKVTYGLNKGEFYGLEPETEYHLYVQSEDISKTTIIEKYITTEPEWVEPEPVSLAEFKEFYFSKTANFRQNSFDISFTYEDPLDEMSDFEFKLSSQAGTRIYSLEKTQERQTLSGYGSENLGEVSLDLTEGTEFGYEFSYAIGNERKVVEKGTVVFTDNSNAKQEFRGVELSREADFIENVIYVTLDFDNDLNYLDNFVFTLKSNSTPSYTFNLETNTNKQALRLNNAILGANGGDGQGIVLEDTAFSYTLSYTEKGVAKTVESTEEIIFEDISGAIQEFRSLTIHENANFIDKCFYVTLDFDNDYLHFSDFKLTLSCEQQPELTFNLATTTDIQTIYLKDALIEGVVISQDMIASLSLDYTFGYYYSYTDKGELQSNQSQNPITFHDESGAKSEFRGITIDSSANFLTKTITATLDLDNDYGYFSNFSLRLQSQGKVTLIYNLDAVNTKQTLLLEDADIESVSGQSVDNFNLHGTFYYELTYYNSHTDEELSTTGSLTFTDNSGLKSEVRGITFDSLADYDQGIIWFTIDMDNELNEYAGFELHLTWDNYEGYYPVSNTNEKQSITLSGGYGNNRPTYYDLSKQFNYDLSYSYLNNSYKTITGDSPITFTDMYNRVSEVRGITIADYYDPSGTLNIQLDVVDDYNVLSNFVLFFFEESEQEAGTLKRQVGSFALSETSNTQTIDLNEQECYFNPDVEYTWTLTYSDARFGSQEMTGSKTITPKYEFYSAEMYSPLQTVGEEYYALVSLGFVDNVNAIDAVTLRLMSTEYDNDYNPILSRDVTLVKKSGYQYVNITSFLNDWHEIIDGGAIHDSGTSTGLPREISINYGINYTVGGEVNEFSMSVSNTLDLRDSSALVGGEALTTSMSFSNPTFEFKLYGRDPFNTFFNYKLEFICEDSPEMLYEFDIERLSNFNIMTDTITVELSSSTNYEPLLNMMRTSRVSVRVRYSSYVSDTMDPIVLLENAQISITD